MTGIAHAERAFNEPFGHGAVCAGRPRQGPDEAARLIILLSTSDHFMIMLGAPLIISTASLQL